jgi:octaprenyl-diphosphate synthase
LKTSLRKDDLELQKVFRSVESDLERVHQRIARLSQNLDPGITGYVDYATEHSGKHLRAALVMFGGKATGGLKDEHDDLAVVVELIHLASLIHDDVLDNADIRRSRPTANAKWGAEISVLLGDCLFAYALKLCTRFENHDILCSVADASNEVCTGEILQTQRRFDLKLSIPDYLDIIRKKTGALFRVSTEMAGVVNGGPPRSAQRASPIRGESRDRLPDLR